MIQSGSSSYCATEKKIGEKEQIVERGRYGGEGREGEEKKEREGVEPKTPFLPPLTDEGS